MHHLRKHSFKETWHYVVSNFSDLDWSLVSPSYRWWHIAIVFSILLGAPGCLLLVIVLSFKPLNGGVGDNIAAVFAPLIFTIPLAFLYAYGHFYRKNRVVGRYVKKLFGPISTDSGIRQEDSDFIFERNGFRYRVHYYERNVPYATQQGKKTKRKELLQLLLYFNYDTEDPAQVGRIYTDMVAYIENKPTARYILIGFCTFAVEIAYKTISPADIAKIIGEMGYMTERFRLSPISPDDHTRLAQALQRHYRQMNNPQ